MDLHVIFSVPHYWLWIFFTYDTHATDWNTSSGRRQVWAGNDAFRHQRLLHTLSLSLSLSFSLPFTCCVPVRKRTQVTGLHSSRFLNGFHGQVKQNRPVQPFVWCGGTSTKFGLHAGNLKFNIQNEEWMRIRIIIWIILFPYFYILHVQ